MQVLHQREIRNESISQETYSEYHAKSTKVIEQSDKTVLDLVTNVVELNLAPSDVISLIHANKE